MTTASSHLSKELKQLIKRIGQTKSKQEEDRIILDELSTIKVKLAQKNLLPKVLKELLIRALYIEMLGHSTPFAYIHAINLTQNKNLILKRMGYLMCSLFFDNNSDLLIMLVATILKDLTGENVHEIVICLTTLGNIMNSTIAGAIQEHVVKLLTHTTDLVRKKAVLILQKIKNDTGVEIPEYKQKLKKALCDREPSVMAASLNLYLEEIRENPRKYRDLSSSFVIILKQVIEHKLPKQFDYHRMPAPWIQIRLMKLLQILGKNDQKASENAYTILEQVLRRAEQTSNNISIAVTYQCVRTIANIYPNQSLLKQAASALSKFLEPKSTNNMKYLGIQALSLLYKTIPKLVEEHQLIIVDCLESKDETLKKQTLDLLYKMTNADNVEIIVAKMLNTLHSSTDSHFRNDLVVKITDLAERHSRSHSWYLKTIQFLFELGSQYLSDDVLNSFLRLVVENYHSSRQFGEEIVKSSIQLIEKITPTDFVLKATTWVLGQIGSSYYENNGQKLEEIFKVVVKCLDCYYEKQSTKQWGIDALVKISSTRGFINQGDMKLILEKYAKCSDMQISQRALESKKLGKYNLALKNNSETVTKFKQGLPFLAAFVENAKKMGAKQYNKVKVAENSEQQLRFTPYETKKIGGSFMNFLEEKKEETKEIKEIRQPKEEENHYEKNIVKSPIFNLSQNSPQKKPKPELKDPNEIKKIKQMNKLFAGTNTGAKKPPPKVINNEPAKKKTTTVAVNEDLI